MAFAISAISKIGDGLAANAQGKQIQANENEAARVSRLQGSANEDSVRRHNARVLGAQRAAAAQSGFDSSSGSFASLQAQSAGEMELDALTGRYQSELDAIGHINRGASARAAGKAARNRGYLSAASDILAAAGKSYFGGSSAGF